MDTPSTIYPYRLEVPMSGQANGPDDDFIIVHHEDEIRRIRLDDYGALYEVPGLYEDVIYDRLLCQSPRVVVGMLLDEMKTLHQNPTGLRILDFGAGNGIVGELLRRYQVQTLVGLDILNQAQYACLRDRPGVYDRYIVADLAQPDPTLLRELARYGFNALITVAALGRGGIDSEGFAKAVRLVEDGGWVAFNVRDRNQQGDRDPVVRETVELITRQGVEILSRSTYIHRRSLRGEPIHYRAYVGRKLREPMTA